MCFSSNFDDLCSNNSDFIFFIAIIVTELARKNRKTALFCQNGQQFGNSTLFDLEGVDPRSQNFGQ